MFELLDLLVNMQILIHWTNHNFCTSFSFKIRCNMCKEIDVHIAYASMFSLVNAKDLTDVGWGRIQLLCQFNT